MSFEPGGLADKLGNRYEGRWVAKQLLRVLNEEIRSVTIEAIGDDEDGVDLWVEMTDGIRQAQQCKARNRSNESWSISDLKNRGILGHLQFQLDRDPHNEFTFVSAVGAISFQDICNSARNSNNNPDDFFRYQVQSVGQERRTVFQQICAGFKLNQEKQTDRAKVFDYLQRTRLVLYADDQNSWLELTASASYSLTGEPETIIATLCAYAENNDMLRKPIHADQLRKYLTRLAIYPKNLVYDKRISPAIEEIQRQFDESIKPKLIGGAIIPREETARILDALQEKKDTILHGPAGYGKSAVLYELTQLLSGLNVPYLPIRLDRRDPKNTASQFGHDMGLQDSPANCLVSISGERLCVLILDQLDAIRWTSAHSTNALDVCKELVRQAQALRQNGKNVTVIICCRTFDLEHDPEIRNWLSRDSGRNFAKIEMKELAENTLASILGTSYNQMTNRQKKILASPQNLAMWMDLQSTGFIPEFKSVTGLMKHFWENRRMVLEQTGIDMEQLDKTLDGLVDYMDKYGKISAPERIIRNWPTVTHALSSHGVIQNNSGQITFCHQSYLDYLISIRLLSQLGRGEKRGILDWLGLQERQSLFRREQLRQLLIMIAEESSDDFFRSIKRLLESDTVRFHLKHLVLELIGQLEDINQALADYCLSLLHEDRWKNHVMETVCFGHAPFVSLLIERKIIAEWLNSDSEETVNKALGLLRSVNEKIPDVVTSLLEPLAMKDGGWSAKIMNCLCWNMADDSDRMFQLRLRLVRSGIMPHFVDWKSLGPKYPLRALQLIEAVATTWNIKTDDNQLDSKQSSRNYNSLEDWYDEAFKLLKGITEEYPAATWDLFVPHIERLTSFDVNRYDHVLRDWGPEIFSLRHKSSISITRGIVELSIVAGMKFAKQGPEDLLSKTKPLENSISPIIKEIIMSVYTHLPPYFADRGISWVLADAERLCLGSGYNEPECMSAARLIEALSAHCSDEIFRNLEEVIIGYHSRAEKERVKYYIKDWRKGYFVDFWGRSQYFLLPALDSRRIQQSTIDLIAVLKRKYDKYPKEHFFGRGPSGGWIGSKLDKSLEKISDRAWLNIVSNKEIEKDRNSPWQQVDEDHAVASSIRHFSGSLRNIAKRFPERFGQLSLRFPETVHPWYVASILDALGQKGTPSDIPEESKTNWQPASVETIEKVFEKFYISNDREMATSFCRLIRNRSEENWSDNTLRRLVFYAINHPDPEYDKLNFCCDKTASEATVETLFQNTTNCVRGIAAEAIGALLWGHTDWLEKFIPAIESLTLDPHPVVRMACIEALLPATNINKNQAVKWFCAASAYDLRVAASPRAVFFFNATLYSHFETIAPLIRRMFDSQFDEVAQESAEEITARWLFHGFFEKELAEAQKGTVPQRKGVAQTASHFLSDETYAIRCQKLIVPFFDDSEKEVRAETLHLFRGDVLQKDSFKELVKTYVRSAAFIDFPDRIVDILRGYPGSLIALSEAIFVICEIFSTKLQDETRTPGSRIPHTASEMSSILLRLYEESQGSNNAEIANRCLDIWDMLFENRVGMVRELTKAIEK